jgi:hypothetical protein
MRSTRKKAPPKRGQWRPTTITVPGDSETEHTILRCKVVGLDLSQTGQRSPSRKTVRSRAKVMVKSDLP